MTEESSFTRRKFTLTEDDDEELQQLADRHYDGNVSLCIRAAVADHSSNLEGNGQRAMNRLARQMRTVTEQSSQLDEDVSTLISKTDKIAAGHTPTLPFRVESSQLQDAEFVYRLFRRKSTGLRIDDVLEQSELPPQRVLQAVELLIDLAYLHRTTNNRYELLSTTQTDND